MVCLGGRLWRIRRKCGYATGCGFDPNSRKLIIFVCGIQRESDLINLVDLIFISLNFTNRTELKLFQSLP